MLGGHYLGEIRAFSVAPSVTSSPARELNDCVTVEGYVISDVITAAQGNRARQAVLRVPESDVISDVISSHLYLSSGCSLNPGADRRRQGGDLLEQCSAMAGSCAYSFRRCISPLSGNIHRRKV